MVPEVGGMYVGAGTRIDIDETETACAVVARGLKPTNDVDINDFHCTTAHAHPRLLRESAKQQGVKLKPGVKLLPCVGCSAAKGFSAPEKKTTHKRSDKIHGRGFVDSTGKKDVVSDGGKQYGHHLSR